MTEKVTYLRCPRCGQGNFLGRTLSAITFERSDQEHYGRRDLKNLYKSIESIHGKC